MEIKTERYPQVTTAGYLSETSMYQQPASMQYDDDCDDCDLSDSDDFYQDLSKESYDQTDMMDALGLTWRDFY